MSWRSEIAVLISDRYIPNEEIPIYFSAADIFIAPYISGTQSAVLKIARGYELPVVLTDAIQDTDLPANSIVVPKANAEALAVGIKQMLAGSPSIKAGLPAEPPTWQGLIRTLIDLIARIKIES